MLKTLTRADVVLLKKNHKLVIRLNKKQEEEKAKSASEPLDSKAESESKIKFS